MTKTKINFDVDKMAVLCNIMNAEIQARRRSRKKPEEKPLYKKYRIIDSTPAVTKFINEHMQIFSDKKLKKLITSKINMFQEILPISSKYGKEIYKKEAGKRIGIIYDLSEEEQEKIESFLDDLWDVTEDSGFKKILDDTNTYKNSIKEIWENYEDYVMSSIEETLGYEPTPKGTICTYIMFPNFNVHRTCQTKSNQTNLFFGKLKEKNPSKIIAYLAHQVVHQPMLPYKSTMTKKKKEEFHAFIKFLTDKDIYNKLTGRSYLDIRTEHENPDVMAKVYPYWLGYKYRNSKNPVSDIKKAIERDKSYYKKIRSEKKRNLYKMYEFDDIDPQKVADFFREKKGISPYDFVEIDFDNRDAVTKTKIFADEDDGR